MNRGWHGVLALVIVMPAARAEPLLSPAAVARDRQARVEMTARGLQYLAGIEREGSLGDARPKAVTALFLLAGLSAGHRFDDPVLGPSMRRAADWLLANSPQAFLGGTEEPNEDHALASTALMELAGSDADAGRNLGLYRKAKAAVEYSLQLQDKSPNAAIGGGWRLDDRTKTNDRLLSAWFLVSLHSARLRDEPLGKGSFDRATAFITASQNTRGEGGLRGGFSVDAAGLAVRSITAAGAFALALEDDPASRDRLDLARRWLAAHPPRWQGPHFYETNFFAVRGLAAGRPTPDDGLFAGYQARLVRLLRERQEADGGFPFPPGYAQGRVAMGRGYATALAILALNVDRGFLPLDGIVGGR